MALSASNRATAALVAACFLDTIVPEITMLFQQPCPHLNVPKTSSGNTVPKKVLLPKVDTF